MACLVTGGADVVAWPWRIVDMVAAVGLAGLERPGATISGGETLR
jgi:hypothetical protein